MTHVLETQGNNQKKLALAKINTELQISTKPQYNHLS